MSRYIALAWNPQCKEAGALAMRLHRRITTQANTWMCVLKADSCLVYCSRLTRFGWNTYQLDGKAGVILGRIFPAPDPHPSRQAKLTLEVSSRILESQGRYLVDHHWGRYVAILAPHHDQGITVIRDPSGAMPCYVSHHRGINLAYSHLEDCNGFGLLTPDINWSYIAAYMTGRSVVTADTALRGVRQVRPGERLKIQGLDVEDTFYWTPSIVHEQRLLDDRQRAARELAETVQACVTSWASGYSRILHQLSGGLDSSIVLACLSQGGANSDIVCENIFTEDPRGDERCFARDAATAAGVELIERPIKFFGRSLYDVFEATKVVSPGLITFVPEDEAAREETVRQRGIEAVFSGHGGDHLFQRVKTGLIAADYVWHHGLRWPVLSVAQDTANLTGNSVWAVLAMAVRSGLLQKTPNQHENATPPALLVDDWANRADPGHAAHPWLNGAIPLPPGKRRQVFDILDLQGFHGVGRDNVDEIYPLMSQPVIELCLQIPSYVLTYGGIDRALAREAFANRIPDSIRTRTAKGATTGYFAELLLHNSKTMRELLLDGALIAEGMVDRQRVERALTHSSLSRSSALLRPLLLAVRSELWLRTWTTTNSRPRFDG